MLLLFVGCSSPPPIVAPEPVVAPAPAATARRRLQLAIGRARESDARACSAIEETIAIAEQVGKQPTSERPASEDLHGLRMGPDTVRPDWNALAEAIGSGPLSTSLITIGGIESVLALPCVAPDQVESWTRRLQAIQGLPVCKDTLNAAAAEVLGRVVESCTCDPVPELFAAKLAKRLQAIDAGVAARYATWTQTPVCEAAPPPQAPIKE